MDQSKMYVYIYIYIYIYIFNNTITAILSNNGLRYEKALGKYQKSYQGISSLFK